MVLKSFFFKTSPGKNMKSATIYMANDDKRQLKLQLLKGQ